MKAKVLSVYEAILIVVLTLPLHCWGQEDDPFALEGVEEADGDEQPVIEDEVTLGLYYLDEDAFQYGKYTGLTDEGAKPLVDFRIDRRPEWDSGETRSWSLQGWRLGLDSRRIEFNFTDQGNQSIAAEYRQIPNNIISDAMTPYQGTGSANLVLPSSWAVEPGSSNTRGFSNLYENLATFEVDTERRWLQLRYENAISKSWKFSLDYKHETKDGLQTLGSIFGYTGGNPRGVILPAPVDYTTDNIEAMFEFGNARLQAGFGMYLSFFNSDENSLVWQNAFGHLAAWDESVRYPDSQGRLALDPDNSYLQFKAYAGWNLTPTTRLTLDLAFGEMEQDDELLPYTVNPDLEVHTPVPFDSLDAEIDTTHFNVRFTSQPLRRLGIALNWIYDDRDNKTPRAVYPYIGGDSQDQRPFEDGRINLPYSYTRQKADAIATFRASSASRLKAGVEYSDLSRDYSEVSDAEEWTWLAGFRLNPFDTTSFSIDYRNSSRDVDAYIDNRPLIESHIPGQIGEDEFENHPLLRKYALTDRDREEYRIRADFYPTTEFNFGLTGSRFDDDYDDRFFGLNSSEMTAIGLDFGWYPREDISLVAYYMHEEYDTDQSSRSFRPNPPTSVDDPARDWFADTSDDVDTWNISLTFTDIGSDRGWKAFDLGFDFTRSDVTSVIDVTATTLETAPLPPLTTDMTSVSGWARVAIGQQSSLRLALEATKLETANFALDNVVPDSLANILLLGNQAPNYDVLLVTAAWTLRF